MKLKPISFPESTKPRDIIAMINTWAYGTPTMSNYNGRLNAGIILIRESGELVNIKPSQKYGDLIRDEVKL